MSTCGFCGSDLDLRAKLAAAEAENEGWKARLNSKAVMSTLDALARAEADNAALKVALERMDALMEMLWKAVPWGDTFNVDFALLNEAPMETKRALAAPHPGQALLEARAEAAEKVPGYEYDQTTLEKLRAERDAAVARAENVEKEAYDWRKKFENERAACRGLRSALDSCVIRAEAAELETSALSAPHPGDALLTAVRLAVSCGHQAGCGSERRPTAYACDCGHDALRPWAGKPT